MQALDPRRYEVVPIGITRQGRWVLAGAHWTLPPDPSVRGLVRLRNGGRAGTALASLPRAALKSAPGPGPDPGPRGRPQVIFPAVPGTGGEGGHLHGRLC